MTWWEAALLGLIQGLTEFLPISSSAHLILPSQILGWPDQGLAFDVAVHLGTLSAVVLYYRKDLYAMTAGSLQALAQRKLNADFRLGLLVVLATLPAVVFGFLAEHWIETQLRSAAVIAATTVLFGVLLGVSDVVGKRQHDLVSLGVMAALVIGFAQVLALIPGTSRSGITMTAALALGFERREAARYSFLLAIPVILLSGGYKLFEVGGEPIPDWRDLALGAVLSGITAFLCIHFFLALINRVGMMPFVYYRLALGVFLLLFLSNGVSVNA